MSEIDAALYRFFNRFCPYVYREDDAPLNAPFPHITVKVTQPSWDASAPIYARIWARGESYDPVDALADQIARAIGHAGVSIPTRTGCVWLYRAKNFAQHMPMPGDPSLQCVYLSLVLQALTE